MSSDAKNFISQLLVRRPEDRLGCGPFGVREIKSHPFFSQHSVDWAALQRNEMEPPQVLPRVAKSRLVSNQGIGAHDRDRRLGHRLGTNLNFD